MVALKPAQVEAFVAKPNPAQPVVLVFGPDAGRVRECAEALIRAAVDNPADPFSLARLDGDELAAEPARLVEEATTIPLFGGRRAVWVRAGARNFAPAARAALVPLLGGDRLASRSELRKLALYARGKNRIELDDVLAVVADASALALDAAIDTAFAGRTGDLEFHLAKAQTAGTSASTIISAALRQAALLHKARLAIESGQPVQAAVASPYLHSRRKPLIEAALNAWTSTRLARALAQLAE